MKHRTAEKTFWMAWLGVFGVALLPALLATLPPFLGVEGRAVVMNAFARFCHQMPSRSPHLLGVQLAVGHRTYGMLVGLALGSLAVLFLLRWTGVLDRYMPRVLAAAALPMAVDWGLGVLGLWANTPLSRMLTGGLFGLVAGYYVTQGLVPTQAFEPTEPSLTREPTTGKPS